MPAAGRLGDKAFCPSDSHGCLACSHPVSGPAVQGSPDVFTNSMPSVRVGDAGIHSACCGPNTWTAAKGSATVFINGAAAHRMGDKTTHCGGTGQLVEGSANVFIGDGTGSVGASGSFQETSIIGLEDAQKSIFKQAQMSERPFCEVCEAGKDRESQEADAFIVPQPKIRTQLSPSVAAQASTLIDASKKGTSFCELCSMLPGASSHFSELCPAASNGQVEAADLEQSKIRAVPGYPESGQNIWRSFNDKVFIECVKAYNQKYGLKEDDIGYWTSKRLKAQAMIESGGSKNAFLSDPLQVNVSGDWVTKKKSLLRLSKGQSMTPQLSSVAALEWIRYKGYCHDEAGNEANYRGNFQALRRYNGNKRIYPKHPGVQHRDWYSNKVLELEAKMQIK